MESTSALIRKHASKIGREVEVVSVLEQEAYAAAQRGDKAEHDRIVSNAAMRLTKDCDPIMLANLNGPLGR